MRVLLLIISTLLIQSCLTETLTVGNTDNTVFSDSLIYKEDGIKIKLNTFDIFDTVTEYRHEYCTSTKEGFRFIHTDFENAVSTESGWISNHKDSINRLTISFDRIYGHLQIDSTYYKKFITIDTLQVRAAGNKIEPFNYSGLKEINSNLFVFAGRIDSISIADTTFYSNTLWSRAIVDSTLIHINFLSHSRRTKGIEKSYLKILNSIAIESME